jgi:hypothetical protein
MLKKTITVAISAVTGGAVALAPVDAFARGGGGGGGHGGRFGGGQLRWDFRIWHESADPGCPVGKAAPLTASSSSS